MGKKKAVSHGGARKGAGRKTGADGPSVTLTVSVPEGLVEKLDAYAEAKGWGRSKTVSEALRALIGRK